MEGFIYLLRSKSSCKAYLGSTQYPNKRIASHNKGHTKTTRDSGPWKCELVVNVGSIEEARKIEKYIKSQKENMSIRNVIKAIHRYYNIRL